MEAITPEAIKIYVFPKWVSRGSTWVTHNGFQFDMTNLPPDTCKIERDWLRAVRGWYNEKVDFVSEEDVNIANNAFKNKEKSCEYCKHCRFFNFFTMKRVADFRKRRAAMPENKRKLNKYSHKMQFVEVDWDQD